VTNHRNRMSAPIPEERLGSRAIRFEKTAGLIGVVGLLLCGVGFFVNRAEFFQSYLFAFIYWGGFTLGGVCVLLMNHVVGGIWGVTTRRLLGGAVRTLPLLILLFIPIVIGIRDIYPWAQPETVKHNDFLLHKQGYLNLPFFLLRTAVYFVIWIFWGFRVYKMADVQDETGDTSLQERMRRFSAPGLLIFVLTASFAYIDWILSADAQYYSTIYGAMILIGDVLQTFALIIIVLVLASGKDRFGGRVNPKVLHDLGNLMFAFTIFWTYLSASQLIITWPANLPQEIEWYLVRVRGGWKALAVIVAFSMFAIPFLALLSQARKRDPIRLMRVAVWILCARAVDIFWIVAPTYRTHGFALYWTDFAAFLGVGGIWTYVYLGQLRRRPLLPLRDPRVAEPMPEAVA
jgi:hypothetical protein